MRNSLEKNCRVQKRRKKNRKKIFLLYRDWLRNQYFERSLAFEITYQTVTNPWYVFVNEIRKREFALSRRQARTTLNMIYKNPDHGDNATILTIDDAFSKYDAVYKAHCVHTSESSSSIYTCQTSFLRLWCLRPTGVQGKTGLTAPYRFCTSLHNARFACATKREIIDESAWSNGDRYYLDLYTYN